MTDLETRPLGTEPAAEEARGPRPLPVEPGIDLPPDGVGYRLKRRLLGTPLHTEQLEHERLGKPTALAVFASDNLSSSAYATEEILRVLVPAVGFAAFSHGHADHDRHARGARVPDPLVPGDDQGVPDRRRRLHGHPRQLRSHAGPGRRRRAAHRLHPDRRRVGRGRHRGARLRLPVLRPLPGRAVGRVHRASSPSATCEASRSPVASSPPRPTSSSPTWSILLVIGFVRMAMGTLPHADPNAHGLVSMRHRQRRRHADGGRRCSSSCTPSHRAARRSPASRPSPTACRHSASPSGRTPAARSSSWGHCSAPCSSACRCSAAHLKVVPFVEGTPTVISQIGELIYGGGPRQRPVLLAAGRDDADPGPGGQHELRRLPAARQLPRRRQLHAPPAHQAGPPPGVLQRDHLPVRGGDRPRHRHRRQGRPPHPALRHRRVHLLHPVPGGHGQAPPPRA